jgi:hypothetical protein
VAESPSFDWLCAELERRTSLDRLESRGTVRLALRDAGLEAKSVTAHQMRVVVERILPRELLSRGVESPTELCGALARDLPDEGSLPAAGTSPEAVFQRLGGRP